MEYVEMLRARRVLTWYGGIIFAMLAIGLSLAFKDGPPNIQMSRAQNPMIPLDAVLAGCAFAPLIIVAFLGVGLDAEYKTTAIAWTRPFSRYVLALRYMAVDGSAMIVAWLIALVAAFIPIYALGLNKYFVVGSDGFQYLALAFGVAVMWYGLIVFFSALVPGRANAVVGLSWAYALMVPGISQIPFPTLLHQVIVALNYINPLAYLGSMSDTGRHGAPFIAGTFAEHVIVVWLIGIAALAVGTYIWANREVPA